jgi:hypothetical protein
MDNGTIEQIQRLITNKEGIVIGTDFQATFMATDLDMSRPLNTDSLSKMAFLLTTVCQAMGLSEDQAKELLRVGYKNINYGQDD